MTLPRKQLAGSALSMTVLGFGAAPIGNLYRRVTDAEAHATVDAAWQGGVRVLRHGAALRAGVVRAPARGPRSPAIRARTTSSPPRSGASS